MLPTNLSIDTLNRRIDLAETQGPTPQVAREEAYFREAITTVTTPEELLSDFRLRSYVLTAFDLDEAINQQALMERVLSESVNDPQSLSNRLADPRYQAIAEEFAFGDAGELNLRLPKFVDDVAARYRRVQLELEAGEINNNTRLASYFDRKIQEADSWFNVLADVRLRDVVFTGLGLPEEMKGLDVDRLVGELSERYDFEDFKDETKRSEFIQRFAVLSDLGSGSAASTTSGSAALSLLSATQPQGGVGLI